MGVDQNRVVDRAIFSAMQKPTKINVVLCPEILPDDLMETLQIVAETSIRKVNLREPYGQPHLGNPLIGKLPELPSRFGMPVYGLKNLEITYWDVHFVEVESINLYASGRVSETYPITRGCAPDGTVQDQSNFIQSGRVREQWVNSTGGK